MIDITVKSYNSTAEQYHEKTKNLNPLEKAKDFLGNIPKQGLILDLGCGTGRDSLILTNKGYNVIGVDPAKEMIKIAKRENPKAQFEIAYAQNLPFKNNIFDGTWACASLIHLTNLDLINALYGIKKSLKPGAPFYSSFKKGDGIELVSDKRYGGVEKIINYQQEKDVKKLLSLIGFEIKNTETEKINNSYATNPWINILSYKPKI